MPFRKRGRFFYSASGRRYTPKQVRYYYASKGFKRKPRKQR